MGQSRRWVTGSWVRAGGGSPDHGSEQAVGHRIMGQSRRWVTGSWVSVSLFWMGHVGHRSMYVIHHDTTFMIVDKPQQVPDLMFITYYYTDSFQCTIERPESIVRLENMRQRHCHLVTTLVHISGGRSCKCLSATFWHCKILLFEHLRLKVNDTSVHLLFDI